MNSGDKVKLNEIKVKSGLQPEIREVKIGQRAGRCGPPVLSGPCKS